MTTALPVCVQRLYELTDPARVSASCALKACRCGKLLDAAIESELTELDDESAAEPLESIAERARLTALARAGFHPEETLTAGPKGSAAWTIHQHTAPKVIHTPEKGFIKAEIVS